MPMTSALSFNLGVEFPYPASMRSTSPSQFRPISPASSIIGSLTRISLNHNPALFTNELEYLYTGKGFGDAFEFLFDANEKGQEGDADVEDARVDELQKDLVFMWRSRLYSDVRVELHSDMPAIGAPSNEEETTAVFCSHRFVLVTRAPYFYDQLITYGLKNTPAPGELTNLRLPSPPFTPPALHFTLGHLYTSTLSFSNRSYDLDTAFAILSTSSALATDILVLECVNVQQQERGFNTRVYIQDSSREYDSVRLCYSVEKSLDHVDDLDAQHRNLKISANAGACATERTAASRL